MLGTLCFVVLFVLASGTLNPAMVVVSESMKPSLDVGTLILIHNWAEAVQEGDVVVFDLDTRPASTTAAANSIGRQVCHCHGFEMRKCASSVCAFWYISG